MREHAADVVDDIHAPAPPAPATVWSHVRGTVSGTASGVVKCLVGHPFDTIKVRMQTQGAARRFNGALDCLVKTVRLEGARALYKGVTPPLIGSAVIDSVLWGSLIAYKRILSGSDDVPLSLYAVAFAGALAGVTTVPVVTPVEQVKARLQVQYADPTSNVYRGPIDCLRQLVRNNGVGGLYHGVGATILFRIQFSLFFASYELYRQSMLAYTTLDATYINFIAGGFAANTLWAIAFPTDLVKNKMMAQADVRPRRYPTVRACFAEVYRSEGVRGFYRGFLPCILRSFPTNGAAFVAAETVLRF